MKPLKAAYSCQEDLQAAFEYYRTRNPLAAEQFLRAYLASIKLLVRNPKICRQRAHGWRQMAVRGFSSHSIFYKEFPGFWLVGGILCTIRDPDDIQARLLIREVGETPEEGK
jgi:plasmid stabilization system protein ParE